ncbi:MAG: transposase [bacterium]
MRKVDREKALEEKKYLIEKLLEQELEELLPGRYAKKRKSKETPLVCPICGPRRTDQLRRNGHYRRNLLVLEGLIKGLKVPRIECKECGSELSFPFKILSPKARYWLDVEERVLHLYETGVPLRKIANILEEKTKHIPSITTIWRWTGARGSGANRTS